MSTTTTPTSRSLGHLRALLLIVSAAIASMVALPTMAAAAPAWDAEYHWAPSAMQPGERGGFKIVLGNIGDTDSTEWPKVEVELPEGFAFDVSAPENPWFCEATGTPETVTCTDPFGIGTFNIMKPGMYASSMVAFTVDVAADAPTGMQPLVIRISEGGAAAPAVIEEDLRVGGPETTFGLLETSFKAEALDDEGNPYTQAGGHPHEVLTEFTPAMKFNDPQLGSTFGEMVEAVSNAKDIIVDAPPGFSGDPLAVPACSQAKVMGRECPPEAQVGIAEASNIGTPMHQLHAVYNVIPQKGAPAQFMFDSGGTAPVLLTPILQSDGEWNLRVHVKDITEANPLFHSEVRLWGVPADPSHDDQRCELPSYVGQKCFGYNSLGEVPTDGGDPQPELASPHASTAPRRALLTLPTECDGLPEVTTQHMASWRAKPFARFQPDGDPDLSDPAWKSYSAEAPAVDGCENLDFEPSLKARPTTNAADSPTGLEVDLKVPQNMDPDGLATAHLRNTTVTLPEGLTINAAGANGLGACSPAQIHLGDRLPDDCPESSKVGTVSVETPILEDPVQGAVYVATPHENPFNSLLAIYIAIDDAKTGIVGKLAGKVTPDPVTGRLTTVVTDNPQVPFEDFKLSFFGGAAASLKTPSTCGTYSTTSELLPWSAPHTGAAKTPKDTWAITQGPGGAPCATSEAALPNAPSMDAGSTAPIAGAHTGFVVNLRREDGSQRFSAITLSPPQGLVAKLANTPACSDAALSVAAGKTGKAEQALASCPAASQIGNVVAGAGVGPAPYYAPGKAYLAGPYKGAPLSMAIITPAVAGPFDLGTIITRVALHVDSKTARITAVSDPIPPILQGIPLDVRTVSVRLDKPDFTLNPTNCDPMAVEGSLLSTLGSTAGLSSRFQLGECARLGFKPKLRLFLKGGTTRGEFPALRAILTPRPGDANIASVAVAMPRSEFLAQNHLNNICTRVQFAADACPRSSIYGKATVYTPILGYPLTGNVYLRASDNPLPDLVPDFRGPAHQPIKLEAAGRTDTHNDALRNTFDFVPDAPFSKLVLQLRGGKKGLLENSRNICLKTYRATVKYSAHNGKTHEARPALKAKCGKKGKGKKAKQGKSGSAR